MSSKDKPKLAVITGAAEGIGQAYAERLATDGAEIVILDRLPGDKTLALIESVGSRGYYIKCDLADRGSIDAAAAEIHRRYGGCDILVNNAAIGSQRSFDDITFPMLREMLTINLEAPFLLCRAMVPSMRERGWGRIVNISTGALWTSLGGFVDYLMSKGGIVGLTSALATELGPYGITVNSIAPGLVRTPMTLGGREGHAPLPEQVFNFVTMLQSIKRAQTPADLVGTMSFLTSDDASLITGQVLFCDGGIVRV